MLNYKNISIHEFDQMLQNKNFFLLDVRSSEQEKIQGTDENIPYKNIKEFLNKLPQDKHRKIIVYCGHGNTSLKASQALLDLGYSNVINLQGGITAYQEFKNYV